MAVFARDGFAGANKEPLVYDEKAAAPPPKPSIDEKTLGGACDRLAKTAATGKMVDEKELPLGALEGGPATERLVQLFTCKAILADSETPCAPLPKTELREDCTAGLEAGRAFRKNPTASGFRAMVASDVRRICARNGPAEQCDAIRQAITERQPDRCPKEGALAVYCKAAALGDPSGCADDGCKRLAQELMTVDKEGFESTQLDAQLRLLLDVARGKPKADCGQLATSLKDECRKNSRNFYTVESKGHGAKK
jgi:hypothetical protein